MGGKFNTLQQQIGMLTEAVRDTVDLLGNALAGKIAVQQLTLPQGSTLVIRAPQDAKDGQVEALNAAARRLGSYYQSKGRQIHVIVLPHEMQVEERQGATTFDEAPIKTRKRFKELLPWRKQNGQPHHQQA